MSGIEDCIAEGLRRSQRSEEWWLFELYALAGQFHPSRAYTEALCEVLARRSDDLNNDDLVDTLAASKDPAAVGCLRDMARWDPPWDEYGQLARKAVWGLGAIGTPEAIAALKEAVDDERDAPREAAADYLDHLGA